jgi:hypothetical protein
MGGILFSLLLLVGLAPALAESNFPALTAILILSEAHGLSRGPFCDCATTRGRHKHFKASDGSCASPPGFQLA